MFCFFCLNALVLALELIWLVSGSDDSLTSLLLANHEHQLLPIDNILIDPDRPHGFEFNPGLLFLILLLKFVDLFFKVSFVLIHIVIDPF